MAFPVALEDEEYYSDQGCRGKWDHPLRTIDKGQDIRGRRTERRKATAHRTGAMKKRKGNWGKTPWTVEFRAKARDLPEFVDVAIVGGGCTGLSAAAIVKKLAPEKSVLLLEGEKVGNGASGRTGGMALAETAAGKLPRLGDVLKGYRAILQELKVKAELTLPGVWELARGTRTMDGKTVRALRRSPINWNDSGKLRAVGRVPGGSVDPGRVVAGLARAAEGAGAQIAEHAELIGLEFGGRLKLQIARRRGGFE